MLLFSDIKSFGGFGSSSRYPSMCGINIGKKGKNRGPDYLIFKNKTDETANDIQSY